MHRVGTRARERTRMLRRPPSRSPADPCQRVFDAKCKITYVNARELSKCAYGLHRYAHARPWRVLWPRRAALARGDARLAYDDARRFRDARLRYGDVRSTNALPWRCPHLLNDHEVSFS
jgi:hypothetical protein